MEHDISTPKVRPAPDVSEAGLDAMESRDPGSDGGPLEGARPERIRLAHPRARIQALAAALEATLGAKLVLRGARATTGAHRPTQSQASGGGKASVGGKAPTLGAATSPAPAGPGSRPPAQAQAPREAGPPAPGSSPRTASPPAPSTSSPPAAPQPATPTETREVRTARGVKAGLEMLLAPGDGPRASAPTVLRAIDRAIARDPGPTAQAVHEFLAPRPLESAGDTDQSAGGSRGRAPDESLALLASIDHAGIKAIALDRAATRMAELRPIAQHDAHAAGQLGRMRPAAADLLASAPVEIATFARAHPDLLPASSARTVQGELLRGGADGVVRGLLATLATTLAPIAGKDAGPRAFAAGFFGGAALCAAGDAGSRDGDFAPAQRLEVGIVCALGAAGDARDAVDTFEAAVARAAAFRDDPESAIRRAAGALAQAFAGRPAAILRSFQEGLEASGALA